MNIIEKTYKQYTRPGKLLYFLQRLYPIFIFFIIFCFTIFLYLFVNTNINDYQQGYTYKIMYIHIPFAWYSLMVYTIITLNSILYLVNKHPLTILINKIILNSGVYFTLLTLFTGALWGKPMWGTFWVWDARLTSVFLLLIIFLIYKIILYNTENSSKSYIISSYFSIIGFINIPIIKFSVNWWNTLHQSTSISIIKNNIDVSMLIPTLFILFGLFFLILIIFTNTLKKEWFFSKIINI